MQTVAVIVTVRVPDSMSQYEVVNNMRSSVEFGSPTFRILYILPDRTPEQE